jgi:hypothetical protein
LVVQLALRKAPMQSKFLLGSPLLDQALVMALA